MAGAWRIGARVARAIAVDPSDSTGLARRADELLEQRLVEITRATPQFSAALRSYRAAQRQDDHATAEGLDVAPDDIHSDTAPRDIRHLLFDQMLTIVMQQAQARRAGLALADVYGCARRQAGLARTLVGQSRHSGWCSVVTPQCTRRKRDTLS